MPKAARSPDDALADAEQRLAAAQVLLEARTHTGVISQFGLEFVKKGFIEEVHGRAFSRAKERREECEYGAARAPGREEAEATVADATAFVDRVRRALDALRD